MSATIGAELLWQRTAQESEQDFLCGRYSRRHFIRFDGGASFHASSSPQVVPLPWSDPQAIDPEESFVAALSSCHMLWFLSIAAKQGYCAQHYHDWPLGLMGRNAQGRTAITQVTLRPQVAFSASRQPNASELVALHEQAHHECFIANSVTTEVRCEPVV